MAKTRAQKVETVKVLEDGFKKSKLIVFSEIKGLSVADITKLRGLLRKEEITHTVAKVSLLRRALNKVGIKTDKLNLVTQTAVSFGKDETAAARLLKNFSREHENLKLLCGFLGNEYIDGPRLGQLASIPSRLDLLGQLASVIAGPTRGLVTVLSGSHRGLVQVLSQIKKS